MYLYQPVPRIWNLLKTNLASVGKKGVEWSKNCFSNVHISYFFGIWILERFFSIHFYLPYYGFSCHLRWDTLLGWYTKGLVEWSVWMSFIYWCSIDSTKHVCAQEREREWQWEGRTLIQVKGSRVSLLCNVHVHKLSMGYLNHICEYKCVY
jgi:hypothetical protein